MTIDGAVDCREPAYLPERTTALPLPPQYAAWIDANYPTCASARYRCGTAVQFMIAAFPELRAARGLVYGEHWWCIAPDGNIIDPTWRQFDSAQCELLYSALDETKPQPTGYCTRCHGYAWNGAKFCSDDCADTCFRDQLRGVSL